MPSSREPVSREVESGDCYWKLRTDPLYPAVAAPLLAADDGTTPVLDIGCGLGLFARYLKEAGFRGAIHGIDYDSRKIRGATRMAQEAGLDGVLTFTQGDAREALPGFRGHVTILDVLHYLNTTQQAAFLEDVIGLVGSSDHLIIRSGLAEPTMRFRVTRLADWFAHGCFWMKGRPVAYPDKDALETQLRNASLEGTFTPLWGSTPFNNYLGVFAKPLG